VLEFKFGGNALSQTYFRTVSSISRVRSFHDIHTLGTMCDLSLGVWGTHLHTLGPNFCFCEKKKNKKKKKKKNLHVHVCLEILVDLRIVI
jgi:hypothetical protein